MELKNQYAQRAITIANGTALGTITEVLHPLSPRGFAVLIPASWTAADLVLEVSMDNVTYYALRDNEGAKVKITGISTSLAGVYNFPATAWAAGAFNWVQVRSVSTSNDANNANQTGAKALTLFLLA